jgi:transposase
MARKHLTPEQRQIIVTLHAEGNSEHQVEAKTGFARSTVHSVIKKHRETGTVADKPGRGRKRKTSERDDRLLTLQIRKNRRLSAESVAQSSRSLVGVQLSPSTVRRRMQEREYHGCTPKKEPYLKPEHIKLRQQFAKAHVDKPIEFWEKVIWSDESKFNLFGSDGRMYVWRQPHEVCRRDCIRPVVKHGGGSVMVWGSFSAGGVGRLVFIDGIMRGVNYRNILDQHLHQSATAMGLDGDFIFQHDNDSKHRSHVVKRYLQEKGVRELEWPSSSPDLNPIEHLWSILGRAVAKKRYRNKKDFKRQLQDAWDALDPEILNKLVASIPRRLAEVIKNKGGHTKY